MKTQNQNRDVWLYRIVVIALGLSALASLIGAIVLVTQNRQAPELLVALGSAAVGGLAGLLAPSPLNRWYKANRVKEYEPCCSGSPATVHVTGR